MYSETISAKPKQKKLILNFDCLLKRERGTGQDVVAAEAQFQLNPCEEVI